MYIRERDGYGFMRFKTVSCHSRFCTVLAVLVFACITIGCAKATVTARRNYVGDEQLLKPNRIIVYDFAATPEDIPADDPIIGLYKKPAKPQTAEEIRLGRQLGDKVAAELVKEILKLGMPAERSKTGPRTGIGDLIIRGEFVSIDEGDRLKRMLIGFGAGAGELKTLVEIYQITAEGLRPLGSGEVTTAGGKMPGMFVPVVAGAAAGRVGQTAIVSGSLNVAKEIGPEGLESAAKGTANEIAKALSQAFARQGWIQQGALQ
jgi:hypothetical protein